MNALKQEGLGLLDYLVIKTGCMYLSDLSQKEMLCEIQHAVRELDPEAFSLWEWNDAVAYRTREPVSFRGKEQAARYLLNYKENREEIMARKKTHNKWFETQDSISYWEDFNKPKIVYPNMTKYMPFVYDDNAYCTNQKCFIITGQAIAYLTAFFNSSLFKFCFRDSFPELQGGTREMSKIFFDKIPVLQVTDEMNARFRSAVNDIQNVYSKSKAMAIDSMIFDLYNLSEKERQVIGFVEIE